MQHAHMHIRPTMKLSPLVRFQQKSPDGTSRRASSRFSTLFNVAASGGNSPRIDRPHRSERTIQGRSGLCQGGRLNPLPRA
jgi:hypothetical protein